MADSYLKVDGEIFAEGQTEYLYNLFEKIRETIGELPEGETAVISVSGVDGSGRDFLRKAIVSPSSHVFVQLTPSEDEYEPESPLARDLSDAERFDRLMGWKDRS